MSWSRILATGSGRLGWRVEIEGYPSCLVSHRDMVQTDSDGRTWLLGLRSDGFEFSEEVDLVTAKAKAGSLRVQFNNPKAGAALFAKRPSAVTYLTSNPTSASTSLTVKGTGQFASSGHLYIDTETIAYSGTSGGDTFTGLTRGVWSSLAQYHYNADGERLRYVEVTDHPVILEGRRVRFYAYGAGDSRTGNGTLVWTGVASTDASFSGISWSFQVDSIYKVLDQALGADLKDPSPIRGIYYPGGAPLFVSLVEYSTAAPSGSPSAQGELAIAGFWETQADFLIDLQAAIDAELSRASFTSTDVRAVPDGDSWAIEFTTASSGQRFMRINAESAVDAITGTFPTGRDVADSRLAASVVASTTYVYRQVRPTLGTVPRATLGGYRYTQELAAGLLDAQLTDVDVSTYPLWRVYVGGYASVTSSTTFLSVDWESTGVGEETFSGTLSSTVVATDGTSRWITMARPDLGALGVDADGRRYVSGDYGAATAQSVPQIRMGRAYGAGTLADFLSTLRGETAQYVNTGAVPFLFATSTSDNTGDIDLATSDIAAAADGFTVAQKIWSVFTEVELSELIEHECRLLGLYPRINADGQIEFKRLRLPSPGEARTSTITASIALTDDQILSWEKGALGLYNTVLYRTGYDPIEDDHKGSVYTVRDVSAFGQSPNARVLEVAPKANGPATYDQFVELAQRVLGVFGAPYAYLTIDVPLTQYSVLVGDVVALTWSKVPGSSGVLGVEDQVGIVVARKWTPSEARGSLTLLLSDQRVGGYVPAATIAGISGTTGTTGPFSFVVSSAYLPGGLQAGDVWSAGDKIRLYLFDSTTTTNNVTGTVSSVTASSMTITTDTNWTYGASSWCVGSQVSTAITAAGQKVHVYIGNADATLDWSGDTGNPVFTLAP